MTNRNIMGLDEEFYRCFRNIKANQRKLRRKGSRGVYFMVYEHLKNYLSRKGCSRLAEEFDNQYRQTKFITLEQAVIVLSLPHQLNYSPLTYEEFYPIEGKINHRKVEDIGRAQNIIEGFIRHYVRIKVPSKNKGKR